LKTVVVFFVKQCIIESLDILTFVTHAATLSAILEFHIRCNNLSKCLFAGFKKPSFENPMGFFRFVGLKLWVFRRNVGRCCQINIGPGREN